MKKSKKATTIVESLVVLLIVVIGVVGTYSIFTNSIKLSDTTRNRLEATQIAREGIEAVINIRDTNWILFQANLDNCWMVKDYNSNCITNNNLFFPNGSYTIYKNPDNRWYLSSFTTGNFNDPLYQNRFRVYQDNLGLYTQTGSTKQTIFTREIKLIPEVFTPPATPQSYKVKSIVRWSDSSRNTGNFEILLETELTNWKKN